ncbi:MAG: pyrimidine 5'-nucleotidase [Rhodospirillaceae bacterium]
MTDPAANRLAEVDTWVFDLDNTLYPASANLFAQIDVRIKAFIADALNMTPDEAFVLQKKYYREHGTSLRGLMINHDVSPDAFLDYVHDIDHSVLAPNPALESAIARLPGRKFVYTNGSTYHAEQTLIRLGIAAHFSEIFDIRASGYVPKPDPDAYADFIAKHVIAPERAAMFEDLPRNLKPAVDLGMTGVWVRHPETLLFENEDTSHCHFVTDNLTAWLGDTAQSLTPR